MKFLTTKRFYFVMIGLNIFVIIVLFLVAFLGSKAIDTQAEKLKTAKTESRVINEQQISLLQAKQDLDKYADLNNVLKSVVPQDKDQAKTIREITKIATETGVAIKDIRFQSSNLGQSAPKPTNTDTSTDQPSTTLKEPALPAISQVKAVDGIKGVFALEIIISSQDSQPTTYAEFISFLEKLETNRRTAHVDKISIKPLDGGNSLNFLITLNAYVKP